MVIQYQNEQKGQKFLKKINKTVVELLKWSMQGLSQQKTNEILSSWMTISSSEVEKKFFGLPSTFISLE